MKIILFSDESGTTELKQIELIEADGNPKKPTSEDVVATTIDGKYLTAEVLDSVGAKSFQFQNGGVPTPLMPIAKLKDKLREGQKKFGLATIDFAEFKANDPRLKKGQPLQRIKEQLGGKYVAGDMADAKDDPSKISVEEAKRIVEDLKARLGSDGYQALLTTDSQVQLGLPTTKERLATLDRMVRDAEKAGDPSTPDADSPADPLKPAAPGVTVNPTAGFDDPLSTDPIVRRARRWKDWALRMILMILALGDDSKLAIIFSMLGIRRSQSVIELGAAIANAEKTIGDAIEALEKKNTELANRKIKTQEDSNKISNEMDKNRNLMASYRQIRDRLQAMLREGQEDVNEAKEMARSMVASNINRSRLGIFNT